MEAVKNKRSPSLLRAASFGRKPAGGERTQGNLWFQGGGKSWEGQFASEIMTSSFKQQRDGSRHIRPGMGEVKVTVSRPVVDSLV